MEGDKTKTCQKKFFGEFVYCNRKKSRTVSDNPIQAESLLTFFKK